MQADDLVVEQLLAGKVRAKDVEQVDRDAAILQLHGEGAADTTISCRISCNVGTVRAVVARDVAKQARRSNRNAWVTA